MYRLYSLYFRWWETVVCSVLRIYCYHPIIYFLGLMQDTGSEKDPGTHR